MTLPDDINGLICIDLWQEVPGWPLPNRYHDWLHSLSQRLLMHEWSSVINASYHCCIDYADVSMFNTLSCYNWSKFDPDVMMEFITNAGRCVMSSQVQRVFRDNAFALYSESSLRKHQMSLVPHVKKWLVVGSAWGMCVHDRPLGLINLVEKFGAQGHEFYGSTWGFTDTNFDVCTANHFEQDRQLRWQTIDTDVYRALALHS